MEKLNKQIVINTKENCIEVDIKKNHKREQILDKNLQHYFVSLTVGKNILKFTTFQCLKTDIYYETIDKLVKIYIDNIIVINVNYMYSIVILYIYL